MKKNNFVVLLASVFLVAGCNGKKPEHTFSSDWSSDEVNHWHACNVSGCDDVSDEAAHTFEWKIDKNPSYEEDGSKHEECSVCHYSKESVTIPQLVHSYNDDEWEFDATDHWHACTDTGYSGKSYGKDLASHIWDGEFTEVSPATYESAQKLHRTCKECGYEDIKDGSPALVHNYEEAWTSDATHHWHECTDEGFSGKEHGGSIALHDEQTVSYLEPTTTSTGHTAGSHCSVCDYVIEDSKTIPMLNTTDYDLTVVVSQTDSDGKPIKCQETWTLKDTSVLGDITVTKELTSGVIIVNSDCYNASLFNKTIDGIAMSYDESTKTVTLNVTKTGGVTLEKSVINVPFDNLVITGEPLVVEAPVSPTVDGIKAEKQKITIDNDTILRITSHGAHNSKSGFNCGELVINEGASLKCRDFKYGIFLQSGGAIRVNGDVSLAGTTYSSYAFTTRSLYFGAEHSLYKDDVFQLQDGTTPITTNDYRSKHLVITKNPDFVLCESTFVDITTGPTESTVGEAQVKCDICGATHSVELPILTTKDYDMGVSVGLSGGKVMQGDSYVWKDTTYGEVKGFTEAVELKSYIKIGDTYMNPSLWNEKYPNAVAAESGEETERVLTLTLSGETNIDLTEYDGGADNHKPIDVSTYSKVVIAGTGTLNINSTKKANQGLLVNNFEIANGAVVKFNGFARGNTSQLASYPAIVLSGDATIKGTLTVDKYASAIYVPKNLANSINIVVESTGSMIATNCAGCIDNASKMILINKGNMSLSLEQISSMKNYPVIKCEADADLTFNGTSTTELLWGYGIYANSSSVKVCTYVQDSATFTIDGGNTCLYNITEFVVGNGTNGETQCAATIKLKRSANFAILVKPVAGAKSAVVINSSVEAVFEKTGSANEAIKFDGANTTATNSLKIVSDLKLVNASYFASFANSPVFNVGDFVVEDASGNPVVKFESGYSADFSGTVPENVPASIAKRS